MRLIILEGMDNTGKSTMLAEIVSHLKYWGIPEDKIYVKHLDKPNGATNEEKIANIDMINMNLCNELRELRCQLSQKYKYFIIDRAWYSEYVYGQIYRNRDAEDIKEKILQLEKCIKKYFSSSNIVLYTFMTDSSRFLIEHEDGLSLSNGSEQLELIGREMKLFADITYYSELENKYFIIVNSGNKFRNKEDILKEIKKTLPIEK